MTCLSLSNPSNGQITYSSDVTPYEYGVEARYTCNTGFGLSGLATRTCRGDGSSLTGFWSGSDSTCERKN